jgi:hypothetical protein
MCYLRLSPDDYHALRRLCSPHLAFPLDLTAFRQLLLFALSDTRPALAERIAGLDRRQVRLLHDHFRRRHPAGTGGKRHAFSGEELRVLAEACASCRGPGRFLAYLRASLAERLRDLFPTLARKVARLSDGQFERLYAQVTGQAGGGD